MKLIKEEFQDKLGRYPLRFTGIKSLKELHDYLFQHFQGYKFAIVFDVVSDEYEEYSKETYVYFLDEIVEEVAHYAGKELKDKSMIAIEWKEYENGCYYCSKCRYKFDKPEYKTPYCPNCGEKMANGIDPEKLQDMFL